MNTYFTPWPAASTKHFGPQRGFSLFELMIALGLMAIIVSLAIPSYRDAIEKRRVTNGAETILSFVTTAQSESFKRNRPVTVSYASNQDGSWCVGAVVGPTSCDCTLTDSTAAGFCALDGTEWVLRDADITSENLVSVISGDGAYAIDPVRGIFMDPNDSVILAVNSNSGQFQMNLSVINTGKITLCLPSVSHDIPGFDQCAQGL